MRHYFAFIYCFLFAQLILNAVPNKMRYKSFDNLQGQTEMTQVRSFAQDNDGLMWIGTSEGLFAYDGYRLMDYGIGDYRGGEIINSMAVYGDTLFVSSGETLQLFGLHNRQYLEHFSDSFGGAVRVMKYYDGYLWAGAEDGLYRFHNSKLEKIEFPNSASISFIQTLEKVNDYLYIGAIGGLFRYSYEKGTLEVCKVIPVVTALAYDQGENCLWVGTATDMLRYEIDNDVYQTVAQLPIVKNLTLDDSGNVLVGTDNGLFVFNAETSERILHDAKDESSISGDAIWAAMKDNSGNIWLGTDNGVSLSLQEHTFTTIKLPSITNSVQGNEIFTITRDAQSYIWLAGNHGAIRVDDLSDQREASIWYQMSDPIYSIPHNHISRTFNDTNERLFLLSDSGFFLYDNNRKQFDNYYIEWNGITRWTYDMCQAPDGSYWLATYDGVFNIDKAFKTKETIISPLQAYTEKDGLQSNYSLRIEIDSRQCLWVLHRNGMLDMIDLNSGIVRPFLLDKWMNVNALDCMMKDSQACIWLSGGDSLLKIIPETGEIFQLDLKISSNQTYTMLEAKGLIWLSTSAGLVAIDRESLEIKPVGITERALSMYYDRKTDNIILGMSDKVGILRPDKLISNVNHKQLRISSIILNGKERLEHSYLASNHFELGHNNNNLTINFSDYDYGKGSTSMFAYRCSGIDKEWQTLPAGVNSVSLNNLSPGQYKLYVTGSLSSTEKEQLNPIASFRIRNPWYFSILARIIYLLVLLLAGWKLLSVFIAGQHIKEERIRSKAKLAFLTNIAHELKTPLSLIMAPLSTMMDESRSDEDRKRLDIMHSNAIKLSSMINRSIEIYRGDVPVLMPAISEIEAVEFLKSIFQSFSEDQKYLRKDLAFSCERKSLFVSLDVQKLESIVTNLLSNSCKYTPDGGEIMLAMSYESNLMMIIVSDTGVGIPEQELPFIFQRFYQSSITSNVDRFGTGVGLSIVKTYVEQMGGKIEVKSSLSSGTTFTVYIPADEIKHEQVDGAEADKYENSKSKPLVAVIDDNIAICKMVCSVLSKDWRCISAHNGRNGLKICEELLPDLIVADAKMPVMDGLEMCRKIRANVLLSGTPIILLSANDEDNLDRTSAESGIDCFISKPFEPALLEARAKQLYQVRSAIRRQARVDLITTPLIQGETSFDEQFLMSVTKTIEDRIDDSNFSVNSLCEIMQVNPKQLYRKVKSLSGLAPVEYIRSIRIKKAALLFQSGRFTVAEVMYMVGFNSSSYFSACFVREQGMTPKEYIAKNRH